MEPQPTSTNVNLWVNLITQLTACIFKFPMARGRDTALQAGCGNGLSGVGGLDLEKSKTRPSENLVAAMLDYTD